MKKAIIFDIGGVLAHDVWEHLFLDDSGIRDIYKNLDRDELEKVGKELWEEFAYTPETQQVTWKTLEIKYWNAFIKYFRTSLPDDVEPTDFTGLSDSFIKPIDGMELILKELNLKGYDLAICSNNNEFWFRRQSEKLNLYRFFNLRKIILSCRVGASKSSEGFEMFRKVVDELGVQKSECVFIDDRMSNIIIAKEFGVDGIYFNNAESLREELSMMGI